MPIIKSIAPEYPRPVSPICADEIPNCDITIVYYDQNDGIEEDEEQRAAKRRRIAQNATAYLRGQSLFILTAQLKGPFDDGWRNPWTKKSARRVKKTTESQDTAKLLPKLAGRAEQASPRSTKKLAAQAAADADTHLAKHEGDNLTGSFLSPSVSSSHRMKPPETSLLLTGGLRPKSHRVEDWLRRNEAYQKSEFRHPNSAPPSPSEGKMKKWTYSRLDARDSVQGYTVGSIATSHGLQRPSTSVLKQSEHLKRSLSSPVNPRILALDEGARDLHSSPIKPKVQRSPINGQNHEKNVQVPCADESRAEFTILKSQCKATQPTMAVCNSSSSHPHPDLICDQAAASKSLQPNIGLQPLYAHGMVNPEGMDDAHSSLNNASASLHTVREGSLLNRKESAAPPLMKEATESSMTNELPSAQLPQLPILPSIPSNLSSHSQLLEDSPHHNSAAAGGIANVDRACVPEVPTTKDVDFGEHAAPEQGRILPVQPEVPLEDGALRCLRKGAEDIVNSTLIADAATVVANTMKRSTGGGSKVASPLGIKKASATKSKRRPASANEEKLSGSSIKSALKVAKLAAMNQGETLFSKAAVRYGDDQQSYEDGVHPSLPNDEGSLKVARASVPKSILKAPPPNSMGVSVSNNAGSSSTKQDAQRQQKLNLVENEDCFDLDGALDELGSYLDTWDAEKQAAGVS